MSIRKTGRSTTWRGWVERRSRVMEAGSTAPGPATPGWQGWMWGTRSKFNGHAAGRGREVPPRARSQRGEFLFDQLHVVPLEPREEVEHLLELGALHLGRRLAEEGERLLLQHQRHLQHLALRRDPPDLGEQLLVRVLHELVDVRKALLAQDVLVRRPHLGPDVSVVNVFQRQEVPFLVAGQLVERILEPLLLHDGAGMLVEDVRRDLGVDTKVEELQRVVGKLHCVRPPLLMDTLFYHTPA